MAVKKRNDFNLDSTDLRLGQLLPGILGLMVYLMLPMLMMPLAGNWAWPGAWLMLAINLTFGLGSRLLANLRNPGILAERSRSISAADSKEWDKVLVRVVALLGPLALWLAAGLDKRWGWSLDSGTAILAVGFTLTTIGYALSSWALISNPFFSGTVRIQRDRGHHVVDQGPYRYVRHPGYAGAILSYLGFPLLLDSWWAYIPAVGTSIVLILRTRLEDQTLKKELEGYREYSKEVPDRLLPYVW